MRENKPKGTPIFGGKRGTLRAKGLLKTIDSRVARAGPDLPGLCDSGRARSKPFPHAHVFRKALVCTQTPSNYYYFYYYCCCYYYYQVMPLWGG